MAVAILASIISRPVIVTGPKNSMSEVK